MNRAKVGFLCTYVPVEIIQAAGLVPVRIVPEVVSHKGSKFLDANFCSYVLSIMSDAMDGKYSDLDGLIFTNSCDAMRRLYDAWKNRIGYPKFIHLLDVPFLKDEKYYYKELTRLKSHLEAHFNVSITDKDLNEAIDTASKRRSIALNLYRERSKGKKADNFFQTIELLYNPTGSFENAAKEVLSKAQETNKKRLLVSGTVLKTAELEKITDAFIVYDDVCTGGRFVNLYVKKSEKPLKAIASAYMNRTPCPRMTNTEDKLNDILKMVSEFSIDGVILYTLKFCDTSLFTAAFLKEELRKRGIPVLSVDDWFIPMSSGALKTRIQAFLEMIGE